MCIHCRKASQSYYAMIRYDLDALFTCKFIVLVDGSGRLLCHICYVDNLQRIFI